MIYLHIGLPKCGSSAIQVYLNERHEELRQKGILYPWPHDYDQLFRTSGGNAKRLLRVARRGYQPREVSRLRSEFESFLDRYEKIIISSESLSVYFRDPAHLHRLLPPGAPVRIVVYLRNQVDKFVSDVNQTIKNAQRLSYSLSERWFHFNDYYKQLKKWESAFGPDALMVKGYVQAAFPGRDVVADFCQFLALPCLGYDTSTPINPSLEPFHLEVMRQVNILAEARGEAGWKIKNIIKDILWQHSVERGSGRRGSAKGTLVSKADLEKIAERLTRSNEQVEREYGVGGLDLAAAIKKYDFKKPTGNEQSVAELLFRLCQELEKTQAQ